MKTTYRAYREGPAQTSMYSDASERHARAYGGLAGAEFLWEIETDTLEEASAIYHLRMGFEPFVPCGSPEPCPKCSAIFYPEGSGECRSCGKIC